jgi:hypothetical protein
MVILINPGGSVERVVVRVGHNRLWSAVSSLRADSMVAGCAAVVPADFFFGEEFLSLPFDLLFDVLDALVFVMIDDIICVVRCI